MFRMKLKGGEWDTEKFLKKTLGRDYKALFKEYGEAGVSALRASTPKDTGLLASSWEYKIVNNPNGSVSIEWHNTDIENDVPIAIILQYGHATRNGYFVEGIDYINPALKPIFDDLAERCWKEVTKS